MTDLELAQACYERITAEVSAAASNGREAANYLQAATKLHKQVDTAENTGQALMVMYRAIGVASVARDRLKQSKGMPL